MCFDNENLSSFYIYHMTLIAYSWQLPSQPQRRDLAIGTIAYVKIQNIGLGPNIGYITAKYSWYDTKIVL